MSVINQHSSKPRPAPGRLFWIIGLAVGVVCGTAVAFGLAEVTVTTSDAPPGQN